jgi:DNA-binding MarR family transcriptional regulator
VAAAPDLLALELERAATFRSSMRRFLARTDEIASASGLTSQRYDLLLMIKTGTGGSSTLGELAGRLSLRQTAATELVNRAEEAGLVERSQSAVDGRVTVLRLTGEGERRLLDAFLALREERRTLARVMSRVASAFRATLRRDAVEQ